MSAVERLQRNQIHPIVLLIRFKSAKQIKEIKDLGYSTDKISGKAVKEMYEHALKLESDYRQCISGLCKSVLISNKELKFGNFQQLSRLASSISPTFAIR